MTAPSAWDRARNVLCVRLDAMGDVLMTTPAIRAQGVGPRPSDHALDLALGRGGRPSRPRG